MVEVFDLQDGSYLVRFKIHTKGQYTLNVVTNDDSANTKTRVINVVSNESAPSESTITFDDSVEVGSLNTVVTQIYDEFGNEVADA